MAYMDIGGLYQKYGLEQTVPMAGGEYCKPGELREIEFKVTMTDVTTTPTVVKGADNINMPAGFVIESVQYITDVAVTSGGTPTFDLGFQRLDRTTELDYNGLIAAETLANVTAAGTNKTFIKGTALAGALVGFTVGANPGYFTINSTSGTYTAGVVTFRVKYRKPQ